MRNTFQILAAALLISAVPAIAKGEDGRADLVSKVQSEAAWRGIEVDRVRRDNQTLHVEGIDRQGRNVTLVMNCAKLGVACPSHPGTDLALVAR